MHVPDACRRAGEAGGVRGEGPGNARANEQEILIVTVFKRGLLARQRNKSAAII